MCMAETVYALLCDHGIEWDVPRLPRQLIYMLKVMRQTDQLGTVPMSALLFEGKSAVVITTSHAQAIALVVEGDQGYEDHIKRPWHDNATVVRRWFRYAETVVGQAIPFDVWREPQTVPGSLQYG